MKLLLHIAVRFGILAGLALLAVVAWVAAIAYILSVGMLHPDAARAAEAARQAPHHSSVLAATLKQRLLSLPPEMQSPLHQQYLNRTQSVLDIARQSLLQKSH